MSLHDYDPITKFYDVLWYLTKRQFAKQQLPEDNVLDFYSSLALRFNNEHLI
jgi:hypothetical protein